MSTKVVTGKVRFSYAHVWEPRADENGIEKYSLCILIPKTDKKTLEDCRKAIEAAKQDGMKTKFGGKANGVKIPLRDGDEERPDSPEYAGMMFINCSAKSQPIILDRNRNEVVDRKEVYSGAWGNVAVNFYPYNSNGNKGVGCGLNVIRKLEDDDNLGGGISVSEAQSMFSDEDDI